MRILETQKRVCKANLGYVCTSALLVTFRVRVQNKYRVTIITLYTENVANYFSI